MSISEHSCLLVWTIYGKQFSLQYKTEAAVRQWPTAAQHLDYVDHVFDVLNLPHWCKIVVCLYQSQLNKLTTLSPLYNKQLHIIYLEGSAFMYSNNAFLSRCRSLSDTCIIDYSPMESPTFTELWVSTSPYCSAMSLFVTEEKTHPVPLIRRLCDLFSSQCSIKV